MSLLKSIFQSLIRRFEESVIDASLAASKRQPVKIALTVNDEIAWIEGSGDPLQPLYFVRHPDNTFSIAKPQPSLYPKTNPIHQVIAKQISFLLSQAPMLDAPDSLERAAHSVTKFAYVHPKTFAKFTRGAYSPLTSAPFVRIKPSPTKWVLTTMMPEDRVIYTPNAIPGLEKILAS